MHACHPGLGLLLTNDRSNSRPITKVPHQSDFCIPNPPTIDFSPVELNSASDWSHKNLPAEVLTGQSITEADKISGSWRSLCKQLSRTISQLFKKAYAEVGPIL